MDSEGLDWSGEENFLLEFDCFLEVFGALLEEDGCLCPDANLFLGVEDVCLLEDLFWVEDVCLLGDLFWVEDVCLLGDLFCDNSALSGEGVGGALPGLDADLVLLGEGAGDDPLGLFGVLVDLGFEPRDLDLLIVCLCLLSLGLLYLLLPLGDFALGWFLSFIGVVLLCLSSLGLLCRG